MKRIKSTLLVSILSMIILSSMGYLIYGGLFGKYTHLMTYIDKLEILENTKDKKIVVVGGSATHFGISAEQIEKETGINTVNMGLHASISMDLYLQEIRPHLSSGDILFVIPEYDYYCTPWKKYDSQNSEFVMLYSDVDKLDFMMSSWEAFPNILYTGWGEWASILKQIVSLKLNGKTTEAYSRYDTNEWGDYIANHGHNTISPVFEEFSEIDTEAVTELADSLKEITMKGVDVYVLFPPYIDYAFDENENVISMIYEELNDCGVKTLFSPNESKYSDSLFYDTVYHLNADGKKQYTELVINNYEKYHNVEAD